MNGAAGAAGGVRAFAVGKRGPQPRENGGAVAGPPKGT